MARVRQTQTEKEYVKQVRRIKQFIRRAEKRGYSFPANVLPDKPKRVTKASVRKLANITPEKLYKKSSITIGGKEYKGLKGREKEKESKREERKRKRAIQKRLDEIKKELESSYYEYDYEPDDSYYEQRDDYYYNKINNEPDFADSIRQGKLVYEKLMSIIDEADDENVANLMRNAVENEIAEYGEEAVMEYMSEVGDELIESAEKTLRYRSASQGSGEQEADYNNFLRVLRGTIPTVEESQADSEAFENAISKDYYIRKEGWRQNKSSYGYE